MTSVAAPDIESSEARYLNRELSRLDFIARVLALSEDDELALLERAKFLAITSENLDEFYQVRLAGLREQVTAGVGSSSLDGLTPSEQFRLARGQASDIADRMSAVFLGRVVPALAEQGIRLSRWPDLDADDRAHLDRVFDESIFPVLTPLAVDPGHPFPHISNLSLNLAVMVVDPDGGRRFARVKVPPLLPRFVVLPDGERFVPLEQVIAAHLDVLFPGMEIESHSSFRVIRNADLALEEDEADDLVTAVELELRRLRVGRAVRLEVDSTMEGEVVDLLVRELELDADDVHGMDGPLDLSGLWAVYELDRPELKDEVWTPVTPSVLRREDGADVLSVIREQDVLVHHPYDSFTTSVEAFIKQAAADPDVLAIKQTLYRTSGDSPIVKALIRAAERGKQVAVLVEVKARFDEQANIAWARALERAGVHVVYGLIGLKTHAKIALVVRQEDGGIRRYCHIGTGNYNPRTARIYEDIGLLTSAPDLGADLSDIFNYITGYSRRTNYRKILVAPLGLRDRVIKLIAEQTAAGADGRIVMKMNGLADQAVIDALYAASHAGVDIDLIVRGICCLRPGVPGLSENIRIRSIVGRFLEHSRVFAFGNRDRGEVAYLMGSADLMPRNLDRRVEVVTPVTTPALCDRLQEILDCNLADDRNAWSLGPDGAWRKVPTVEGVSATAVMNRRALEYGRRWLDVDDDRALG